MLKITEQTPHRLVLEERRIAASVFAALFTLVSVFSVVGIFVQGVEALCVIGRDMTGFRVVGLAIFILIGIGFTALGVAATLAFANGVFCVLDKQGERLLLRRMNIFRKEVHSQSIYAISHLDVEKNAEFGVYAVYITLRSGEKLTLATFRDIDEEPMQHLIQQVRAFLWG